MRLSSGSVKTGARAAALAFIVAAVFAIGGADPPAASGQSHLTTSSLALPFRHSRESPRRCTLSRWSPGRLLPRPLQADHS